MTPAPIAIFAFNRPDHLRRTLAALAANELADQSHVTFFCDGPRDATKYPDDAAKCDEVREIARGVQGFASVRVFEQKVNQGLASSIIAGITAMLKANERVIVLEDDLVTSPYFLRFMNDGLECYADNEKVASIHGYCFPHNVQSWQETFFLKGADCWGWATWRRAWDKFEADASFLFKSLEQKCQLHAFDRYGAYNYSGMLQDVISGKTSSWAVRWLASAWLDDMYTLYPSKSLVSQIGFDGSGTHCGQTDIFDVDLSSNAISVNNMPVFEDDLMAKQLSKWLYKCSGGWKQSLKVWLVSHFPFLRLLKNILSR